MRAGNNIVKLGNKRCREAYQYYLCAGGVAAAGLVFLLFAGISLQSFLVIIFLGISSGYLVYLGNNQLNRAGHAYQGARAETEIEALLTNQLTCLGWQFKYNFNFPRYGDIDVVAFSPSGKLYAIDVKSHKGTKQFINGELVRRYGKDVYPFKEGNLLKKVQCQADYISSLFHKSCTPILCFTKSSVDIKGSIADGVYVLSKLNLIDALKKLG